MAAAAKKQQPPPGQAELPKQPQIGDRIRLKPERITAYVKAGEQAGYEFDAYAVRTVIRQDSFNPGGGRRLFIDGAPHCFASMDVKLAWSSEAERREELRRRGWKV